MTIFLVMLAMFTIRLVFLKKSITNEKAILAQGGQEFGAQNTKFLTLLHIMIYVFAVIEALLKQIKFDGISFLGLLLMLLSVAVLYEVTRILGDIWTVKLMLAKDHKYVDNWLFKTIKHPNYFLNIAPELVGIALLCHAKITAMLLFPCYIVVIYLRIREENKLLAEVIIPNGTRTKP
ncbi:TPA: isoprenylcysteine carboxyl methyltransferase family protein [Streptococcus pyogenes NGAS450]|nr:isoprenylcysteine carboxyl methyltransferase family protein [Streptococcus pyogenes]HER4666323.1 isoprenylcysteine carboxyl methyltransferase family protein [Streptococcus pyogenes NGAS450]HES0488455.1 isoprenylcysteine carboxyl methyltransferase family protein [Streptococcus pyogenes]HES2801829.1 isoprenylcysteine carboxyl methyltransferase family protein [Streptococcus pyogenes]HES3236284.1 isoprenylcysteine carboxyl methyltransferase family protein [Streptococcus pyogenes]